MDVEFWKGFWALVLLLGCLLFLGLSIVVTVGGLGDVRALFRRLAGEKGDLTQRRKDAKEER